MLDACHRARVERRRAGMFSISQGLELFMILLGPFNIGVISVGKGHEATLTHV